MIVDNNLYMSDAQAVTASAASTKSLDFGSALRHIGDGEELNLVVQVASTLTSGGSATVQVSLQDSTDNSSFTTVASGPAIAYGSLPAGTELLRIKLPAGLRRYIQVYYTIGTADLTGGTFNAFLTLDRQNNIARPSGFSVL